MHSRLIWEIVFEGLFIANVKYIDKAFYHSLWKVALLQHRTISKLSHGVKSEVDGIWLSHCWLAKTKREPSSEPFSGEKMAGNVILHNPTKVTS